MDIDQLFKENNLHVKSCRVSVDSRSISPGDLFFALKGENSDGHQFISEVRAKGAIGAVVEKEFKCTEEGFPLIRVEDPLKTLQELAKSKLRQSGSKVVGITGSVGKTTTKEFAIALLSEKFRVEGSPGNYNSQIGLPLAVLNHFKGDEEVVVLEMGMSGVGEIRKLTEIAPPDVAVVTAVELVHAFNFDSLDDIAREKAQIYGHPNTQVAVIPEDSTSFELLKQLGACRKVSFSLESSDSKSRLQKYSLPIPGRHNQHNLLAAIAIAELLGMEEAEWSRAIPKLKLPDKRLQFVEKRGVTFINDSYNASVPSVIAALEALPVPKQGGKRVAVLGSMLELGKFSKACHEEIAYHALKKVDAMLCFGEECRDIVDVWKAAGRDAELFDSHEALVEALRRIVAEGDVVLIKGSQSKQMWKILEQF